MQEYLEALYEEAMAETLPIADLRYELAHKGQFNSLAQLLLISVLSRLSKYFG